MVGDTRVKPTLQGQHARSNNPSTKIKMQSDRLRKIRQYATRYKYHYNILDWWDFDWSELDSKLAVQEDIDALLTAPSSWVRGPADHYTPEHTRLDQIERNKLFHETELAKKAEEQERERAELQARLDYAERKRWQDGAEDRRRDAAMAKEIAELQSLQELFRVHHEKMVSQRLKPTKEFTDLRELKKFFKDRHDAILERRTNPVPRPKLTRTAKAKRTAKARAQREETSELLKRRMLKRSANR